MNDRDQTTHRLFNLFTVSKVGTHSLLISFYYYNNSISVKLPSEHKTINMEARARNILLATVHVRIPTFRSHVCRRWGLSDR